ncbi:MAG: hypothetical protein DME22_15585 [Verrucomicrobia bacterium]|nr:MAG: hypothetical protein DME22_15585 [Verrucomicrobiota bacterium]PYJ95707.1 MAG: hypothetical protein DME23_23110 [Verrucomicrobiota bacterium]
MTDKNKPVTIAHAQAWYGRADGVVKASMLREVINWMIQNNVRTEFENDSYLDALVLTEIMFDRSNHSIRMFTGPSCEKFLQTLEKTFVDALQRLKANNGKVQILVLADHKPEFLSKLESTFPQTLEIGLGKMREGVKDQIGHFFVCDCKMARIEQPHDPLNDDTPVNAIRAKVYFNAPGPAQLLEARFDAFWNVVHPRKTEIVAALEKVG